MPKHASPRASPSAGTDPRTVILQVTTRCLPLLRSSQQTRLNLTTLRTRSFKKCCISNALDGSEDDILWEDDGEDKDDSDWVTDNDSAMSDDGQSDE